MIKYILTRLLWFYFGGFVAMYPWVASSLQHGSSSGEVIKDWLLWPVFWVTWLF